MMSVTSRSSHQGQTVNVTSSGHGRRRFSNMNYLHATETDKERHNMTCTKKVLLCAQFFGMEATVSFQQIYTVPALQTLGMPLSLTYIIGLVSGPCSIFLLPPLGWLIDRERNSQRRKFASIVLAAALQIMGMLCLLSANAMHLLYLTGYDTSTQMSNVSGETLNGSSFPELFVDVTDSTFGENVTYLDPNGTVDFFTDSDGMKRTAHGLTELSGDDRPSVPLKAVLALFGCILMDFGFDCSVGFIKGFIVSCSPRKEQTSLIMMGVIMGAVGGVANAILGLVDFTSLLGFTSVEGAKLTIQTSVQGVIIVVTVVTGLLITVCTGRKQLRELQENTTTTDRRNLHESRNETTTFTEVHKPSTTCCNQMSDPVPDNVQSGNSLEEAGENSIRSRRGNNIHMETSVTLVKENTSPLAEDVPLLEDDPGLEKTGYGSVEFTTHRHTESIITTPVEIAGDLHSEMVEQGWLSCVTDPKIRILFVCITTFFCAASGTMYTYAISDFVGKAVYGGDPEAQPGSDSLNRYQEGMAMASWALLVYFVIYLVSSVAHQKILAFLGFRLEFLLLLLLSSTLMLLTGLTSRMETVFSLSIVEGVLRTCFYSTPFAVTNDIAQTITCTKSGRSPVSLAIALVAASCPLSYFLLFTWVGAIEQLTGDVSAPMWLGCAYGILGMIAPLFVGKV